MRRTTAAFLLTLVIFTARPSDPATTKGERDFVSRIRAAIHRIAGNIRSSSDMLTPPKP